MLWIFPVATPLLLFPIVDFTIAYFSDIWILLYLLLLTNGSIVLLGQSEKKKIISIAISMAVWFIPFQFEANQKKYYDQLTKTIQTRNREVDVVTWKDEQWYYYNNTLVLSTVDGHIHSEALVHTTIPSFDNPKVLLIGDDFGFTRQEIHKYQVNLTHVPFDYELAENFGSEETVAINESIISFLQSSPNRFDLIIVDLPDPEHLIFKYYYEEHFYEACVKSLTEHGALITNAGSYYIESNPYQSVASILNSKKLETTILQSTVPTLGHRVWVLGAKAPFIFKQPPLAVKTSWYNQEALELMKSSGKKYPL